MNIRDNNVQYFNLGHVHKPVLLLLFFYDCPAPRLRFLFFLAVVKCWVEFFLCKTSLINSKKEMKPINYFFLLSIEYGANFLKGCVFLTF